MGQQIPPSNLAPTWPINSWSDFDNIHPIDFFELILVPESISLESKLTITPSHILLLDIGIDHDGSVMIFQDWSCKGNKCHDRIFHNPIHIGDCKYVNRKEVNKVGFREPPHYLDWVAMIDPIRSPSEPPPKR